MYYSSPDSQWLPMQVIAAILTIYLIYRQLWAPFSFFAKRGIVFRRPWPVFGNYAAMTLHLESLVDVHVSLYNEFKSRRFYGLFDFHRPVLNVVDPELIRNITVRDFDHFVDHLPLFENVEQDPLLGRVLIMLKGAEWRQMRTALTPAFTGIKMRRMFQTVAATAAQTVAVLVEEAHDTSRRLPIGSEMKELCSRFTSDIFAAVSYGIRVNSHRDRNNAFFRIASEYTDFRRIKAIVGLILVSAMPGLTKLFGFRVLDSAHVRFFDQIVQNEIELREREDIQRPDIIQMMMEARRRLPMLQPADVSAQCFMFFMAGFDTIASLVSFAAHELMENPAVQRRLIEELDAAKESLGGGELTHDVLNGLRYLDCVLAETLRKWPPTVLANRVCCKPYRMTDEAGRSVCLEPGDAVSIPLIALQRDAEYFADPERFDPERFSEERKHEIRPFTYLPFGSGPRSCIGQRFGLMVGKTFLFHLLTNFTFERTSETETPIRLLPNRFVLMPKNGLNVWLKPRRE